MAALLRADLVSCIRLLDRILLQTLRLELPKLGKSPLRKEDELLQLIEHDLWPHDVNWLSDGPASTIRDRPLPARTKVPFLPDEMCS